MRGTDVEMDSQPPRLVIRETKFRKSRLVPVDASTAEALSSYAATRKRLGLGDLSQRFFISDEGTPLAYSTVGRTFLGIVRRLGIHAAVPIVEAETPSFDHGEIADNPIPAPKAIRIRKLAAPTKAPPNTAAQETPDEFASLRSSGRDSILPGKGADDRHGVASKRPDRCAVFGRAGGGWRHDAQHVGFDVTQASGRACRTRSWLIAMYGARSAGMPRARKMLRNSISPTPSARAATTA